MPSVRMQIQPFMPNASLICGHMEGGMEAVQAQRAKILEVLATGGTVELQVGNQLVLVGAEVLRRSVITFEPVTEP